MRCSHLRCSVPPPNPDLGPERSSNWEVGANFRKTRVFPDNDTGMIKFNYFNWGVKDYIAQSFRAFPRENDDPWFGMWVYNIDSAHFSGRELSARYEKDGFAAEPRANYYLDVTFCQTDGVCENKSMYGDAVLRVDNLTDLYYVDPLSLVQIPGPGRTFYASMIARF